MLWGSLIKIWNLENDMKEQNKKHQNAKYIGKKLKTKGLMFFVSFFHVICKISFNMWIAKHLAQASCTELTLLQTQFILPSIKWIGTIYLLLLFPLELQFILTGEKKAK